jgi:hypothetical protein
MRVFWCLLQSVFIRVHLWFLSEIFLVLRVLRVSVVSSLMTVC